MPPGRYRITLHFAEISYKEPGKRVFDVLLEGQQVLESYDPFARAKGFATATKESFEKQVEDAFDIEFHPRAGLPKISAIEVQEMR